MLEMMLPKLVPIIPDLILQIEQLFPELTDPDAPPQMMEQAMAKMQVAFQNKVDQKLL